MLIELLIKSTKSFNALEILVKLPISYIDSDLKPFFQPPLEDETKQYRDSWQEDLESIRDPANKYVYVSHSRIMPERAQEFVKVILSSDTITNRTRIFLIDENDDREKTGNISFFV